VAGALGEGDDPTFEPHRTSRRSSMTTSYSLRAPGPSLRPVGRAVLAERIEGVISHEHANWVSARDEREMTRKT
jgi:hypothetical protein